MRERAKRNSCAERVRLPSRVRGLKGGMQVGNWRMRRVGGERRNDMVGFEGGGDEWAC